MIRLTDRQRRERRHHDFHAQQLAAEELLVEESFTAITALENRFVLDYFGSLAGRRILDLGAGAGEASLFFASRGARVTALDISLGQLGLLAGEARRRDAAMSMVLAPGEGLPFADATFDLVYGYGVLHHIEFRQAIPEVRRVLKPGGRAAFVEPLMYNPLIWVYRWMASGWRSPDEYPFSRSDIRWVTSQLARGGHREFWIASQGLFVYFLLCERVLPSQDRYWKRVLRDADRYAAKVRPLLTLDRLLTLLPGIRLLAYNTVVYGERSDGAPGAE